MKNKRKLCFIFAILFMISLISSAVFAASEDELNAQKEKAQQARDAAQYQVDMTQNTIDGITNEINKSNAEIEKINAQISALDAQIATVNQELDQQQKKLEKAVKAKEKQEKELEERMRVMYMYGTEGYVEVLFSSKDVSDFIEKAEVIISVMGADQDALTTLDKAQKEVEKQKKEIEAKKTTLDNNKKEQVKLQAEQENIKAQQNELLAQNQEILNAYAAQVQEQEAIIREAENGLAQIAAQRQAEITKQSGGSSRSGSSTYIWPSDCYEITDYFGWREQPCAGASTYHQGIDIGASYGTPIYACASGTVVLAEYYGGYGNCVMIAHDTGYTTVYGHQSELNCYEGQWVSQGQVIGYVGSTGASTGPHIHLSFIDPYGDFVDPLNFVN